VTLEDLIEELVGEIVDEFDVEEAPVEELGSGELRVSARLPVDEVNELINAELPTGAWDTVGGLVFDLLGHVPVAGESVTVDGLRLVADRVTGRRIERVRIVPVSLQANDGTARPDRDGTARPAGSRPARTDRDGPTRTADGSRVRPDADRGTALPVDHGPGQPTGSRSDGSRPARSRPVEDSR
jgi:hypothetical protein